MIKNIITVVCLSWSIVVSATIPIRPATQKEINASKSDLVPSMAVNIVDYDSDTNVNEQLQKFLLSRDLDLLTCFTALENKSLIMPNGELTLTVVLNLLKKVSVITVAGAKPKQSKKNYNDLKACVIEQIAKKAFSIEKSPKKMKSEVILSFSYSMPRE